MKRLGFQKASKMESKSVQNHEKSIQNRSKIDHWRLSAPKVHPKHVPDRFFAFFFQFLEAPGHPKMKPTSLKIVKNPLPNDVKKRDELEYAFFFDFDRF